MAAKVTTRNGFYTVAAQFVDARCVSAQTAIDCARRDPAMDEVAPPNASLLADFVLTATYHTLRETRVTLSIDIFNIPPCRHRTPGDVTVAWWRRMQ